MDPTDIDRTAPVVVALERRIAAPATLLWDAHRDVVDWPAWQHDIVSARLEGDFAPGGVIVWETAGIDDPIPSVIYAVDEAARTTLWGGTTGGITGIHHWSFTKDGEETVVRTEESWAGAPIEADADRARAMLTTSLERWLDDLGATASGGGESHSPS